LNCFCK